MTAAASTLLAGALEVPLVFFDSGARPETLSVGDFFLGPDGEGVLGGRFRASCEGVFGNSRGIVTTLERIGKARVEKAHAMRSKMTSSKDLHSPTRACTKASNLLENVSKSSS